MVVKVAKVSEIGMNLLGWKVSQTRRLPRAPAPDWLSVRGRGRDLFRGPYRGWRAPHVSKFQNTAPVLVSNEKVLRIL